MPVDPNDVDALIENLIDAFSKATLKGVRVRVDENEMIVTYEGVERARVLSTGEVPATAPKQPLSSLLRHPGESQAEAEKRVLGDDGGA
jgi:hypothetical protein